MARLCGERRFVQSARHQLQPAVSRGLSDGEGRVADAQPGMAALVDIGLRAAKTEDQEIAEPSPRSFQIVRRVQGPQYVVVWDLSIKRVRQALKSGLADD